MRLNRHTVWLMALSLILVACSGSEPETIQATRVVTVEEIVEGAGGIATDTVPATAFTTTCTDYNGLLPRESQPCPPDIRVTVSAATEQHTTAHPGNTQPTLQFVDEETDFQFDPNSDKGILLVPISGQASITYEIPLERINPTYRNFPGCTVVVNENDDQITSDFGVFMRERTIQDTPSQTRFFTIITVPDNFERSWDPPEPAGDSLHCDIDGATVGKVSCDRISGCPGVLGCGCDDDKDGE